MDRTKRQLLSVLDGCLQAGEEERPENRWLKERYDRFRKNNGNLGKAEADERLYRRMYGEAPEKASATLKLRYWRTGRHLPATREQCEAFGRAMELSEEEMGYLIKAYYDHSDRVFEEESTEEVYLRRKALMDGLIKEYLDKVHPYLKLRLYRFGDDMEHSLRHLYYTDAQSYLKNCSIEDMEVNRHITSINYESEFSRQVRLLGEIPRRTMIRHLVLFGMPFINRKLMNERLAAFGYLPLLEEHTQVDGSRLDRLILGMLRIYETACAGKEPMECVRWFHQMYAVLDCALEEKGCTSLRFLYFKALRGSE